jgi:phosphopantothenoylcysteine decarboxylase/phosphopantothenate--cysteine ligase
MSTSGQTTGGPAGPDLRAAADSRIIVCVTGGIAAYKTATVVSRLAQAGAQVTVAMTEAATHFVTPLTFQALSARPVYTSAWQHVESQDPQHISLASAADLVVVAPCTMDCMAKLAAGTTDDIVTLILSAVDRKRTPVLLAPAMNSVMWGQASTQRNLRVLLGDGFEIIGPGEGWQACRHVGAGRMSEPELILERIGAVLAARDRSRVSSAGS